MNSQTNLREQTRPRSRRPFWLMLALSISIVGATTLLSNDMQHLRSLAPWLFPAPQKAEQRSNPKRGQRGRIEVADKVVVNSRLVSADLLAAPGLFMRQWGRPGPDLCARLSEKDFRLSQWQRSAVSDNVYECFNEPSPLSSKDDSIFLLVRGDKSGGVESVRLKYSPADLSSSASMGGRARGILEKVIDASGWTDLRASLPALFSLKPTKQAAFGTSLEFAKELSGARYNLSLTLDASGERASDRRYFDRQAWLPFADYRIQKPLDESSMQQSGENANPEDR